MSSSSYRSSYQQQQPRAPTAESELLKQANKQVEALRSELIETQLSLHQVKQRHEDEVLNYKRDIENLKRFSSSPSSASPNQQSPSSSVNRNNNNYDSNKAANNALSSSSVSKFDITTLDEDSYFRKEIKTLQLQLRHTEDDIKVWRDKYETSEREIRMVALERDSLRKNNKEIIERNKLIENERLEEIEKLCDQVANLETELQIEKMKNQQTTTTTNTNDSSSSASNPIPKQDSSSSQQQKSSLSPKMNKLMMMQNHEDDHHQYSRPSSIISSTSSPTSRNPQSNIMNNNNQGTSSTNMQQVFALQTENDSLKLRVKNSESKLEQAQARIDEQTQRIRDQQETIRKGNFGMLSLNDNNISNTATNFNKNNVSDVTSSSSSAEIQRQLSDALADARRAKHTSEELQRVNSHLSAHLSSIRLQYEHLISDNVNLEQRVLQCDHGREILKHHVDLLLANQKSQRDYHHQNRSSSSSIYNNTSSSTNKQQQRYQFLKEQEIDLKEMLTSARDYESRFSILALQHSIGAHRLEQEQLRLMNGLYLERVAVIERELADNVNDRIRMDREFRKENRELRAKIETLTSSSASPHSSSPPNDANTINNKNVKTNADSSSSSGSTSDGWAPLPMIVSHQKIKNALESQLRELSGQIVKLKVDNEMSLSAANTRSVQMLQTNLFSVLEQSRDVKQEFFEAASMSVISTQTERQLKNEMKSMVIKHSELIEKYEQQIQNFKSEKSKLEALNKEQQQEKNTKDLFASDFASSSAVSIPNTKLSTTPSKNINKRTTVDNDDEEDDDRHDNRNDDTVILKQLQQSVYESFRAIAECAVSAFPPPQSSSERPVMLQTALEEIKATASSHHESFIQVLDDENKNTTTKTNRTTTVTELVKSSLSSLKQQWQKITTHFYKNKMDIMDFEAFEEEERNHIVQARANSLTLLISRMMQRSMGVGGGTSSSSNNNNDDFSFDADDFGMGNSSHHQNSSRKNQQDHRQKQPSSSPSSRTATPRRNNVNTNSSNYQQQQNLFYGSSPSNNNQRRTFSPGASSSASPSTAAGARLSEIMMMPNNSNSRTSNNNSNNHQNTNNTPQASTASTTTNGNDQNNNNDQQQLLHRELQEQSRAFSRQISGLSYQNLRSFTTAVLQLKRDLSKLFSDSYGDFLLELTSLKRDSTYINDVLPMRKERDAALAELADANRATFNVLDTRKDLQKNIEDMAKTLDNERLLKSNEQERARDAEMELRSAKERLLKMEKEATDLRFALHKKQKSDNDQESVVVTHLSEQQRSLMQRSQELEREKMNLELRLGDLQSGQLALAKRTKVAEADAEQARIAFDDKVVEIEMGINQINKLKQQCDQSADRAEHLKALLDQESMKLEQSNREAEQWRSTAQDLQRRIEVDENLMKNIMGGGSPGWMNNSNIAAAGLGGGDFGAASSPIAGINNSNLQQTSSFLFSPTSASGGGERDHHNNNELLSTSSSSTMNNNNTNNMTTTIEDLAMKNSEKALIETQIQRARLEARIDAAKSEGAKSITDLRRIWEEKEKKMAFRELQVQEQKERLDAFCEAIQDRMAYATNSERDHRHRCDVLTDMNEELRRMCGLFLRKIKKQTMFLRSWETRQMSRFDFHEFPRNDVACQTGERGRLEINAMASASARFASEYTNRKAMMAESGSVINNNSSSNNQKADASSSSTNANGNNSKSSQHHQDTTQSIASRSQQQQIGRNLFPLILEAFQSLNETDWFGIPALHFIFAFVGLFSSFVMGNISKTC